MADEHTHDHDHDCDNDHDHDQDQEVLEQNVKVEDAGPARKRLTIEIPADRINSKVGENFEQLQHEAAIPGFRKGSAPLSLLKKRFDEDVKSEVCSQLVAESYSQAIEENKLRVLGEPDIQDIDDLELPEDGPLEVVVEIEVVPDFDLPDLKGIEVKKVDFGVTDEKVDAEVERICETQGKVEDIEEAAAESDGLVADVEIKNAEGEVLESYPEANIYVPGKAREYKGVIVGILVEDLGKSLEGKKAGDEVTIETKGPEQHEIEAIRGADITITAQISKVQRLVPAKLEDVIESTGFEDETALREQIKFSLEQRSDQQQQQLMQKQVLDALLDGVEFEIPEQVSSQQAYQIFQRRAVELLHQGVSQQQIEEHLAELRDASAVQAQRELKSLFILDKVAEALEVEVSNEEVNGQVAMMAMQQGRRPERLRDEMQRNGQLDQMFVQIRERKAIDKLLEDAKIVEVSEEEWNKSQEKGEAEAKKSTKKKSTKKKSSSKKKDDDKADDDKETAKKTTKKKSTKKKSSKKKSSSKKKED